MAQLANAINVLPCDQLITRYFPLYHEIKQQAASREPTPHQQTIIGKQEFNEKIMQKIKQMQFDEIFLSRVNINYNVIQSNKFVSPSTLSPLTNEDMRQVLDKLNRKGTKMYDPGDTIMFFLKCITELKNKNFVFNKSEQNNMAFVQAACEAYQRTNGTFTSIRGNSTLQNRIHNEIHNFLFHLLFRNNLMLNTCDCCHYHKLGRREIGNVLQPFYCFDCWKQYDQKQCDDCHHRDRLGAIDQNGVNNRIFRFYCFGCWYNYTISYPNGTSWHVPPASRPPRVTLTT
eukprot:24448_1